MNERKMLEIDFEIDRTKIYLEFLLIKKLRMIEIEEGHKASAEILTEKLMEKLCERKEK